MASSLPASVRRIASNVSTLATLSLCLAVLLFALPAVNAKSPSSSVDAVPVIVPSNFVNSNLHRIIDLTAPAIVRETIILIIKPDPAVKDPVDEYYLAVPSDIADVNLASIKVSEKKKAGEKEKAKEVSCAVEKAAFDVTSNTQYFKVKLSAPLKGEDDKTTLYVKLAYTHLVAPFPHEIPQTGRQLLLFQGDAYLNSPYESEKQKTTFKLPSSDVSEYTSEPKPVSKSGKQIVYGPYTGVAAHTSKKIIVHYAESQAILVAKNYARKVEISHWGGNMAVHEDIELHHQGARLKGHFSRIDYTLTAHIHDQTNVVKHIKIALPGGARDVYYRDAIGNVSTSNFRSGISKSELDIRPRYPLFGGWKYTWFHSYNVPFAKFVQKQSSSSALPAYRLSVPFLGGIPNITIDKMVMNIVLPEGATNVQVRVPFPVDKQWEGRHYTYLDTIGRPSIFLEKHNVVDEYNEKIEVLYDLPAHMLLLKPLASAVAFFIMFSLSMVYWRLDLAITKDPKTESAAIIQTLRLTVQKTHSAATSLFSSLNSAFDTFKSTKDADAFKSARSDLESRFASQIYNKLENNVASSAESHDPKFAKACRTLSDLYKEKNGKLKELHLEVVSFLGSSSSSEGVDEKKKKQLHGVMERVEKDVADVDRRIADVLSAL
ncbi:proteasome regulatory particle base subunit [Quaeritorhiza haematococci]|nr:proteasome regulatory particle base subunit [Quaeritorhiza haematococci]